MLELAIIELDSIDSTNNYAMQLIDADKAQHGLTIIAQSQTGGKGQRGKTWEDAPGQSLLMSIIVNPTLAIRDQFSFNASVATAVANVLRTLYEHWKLYIKWPNDIIINDKKAGGILVENVLRGSRWTHSVIGIGLNVRQDAFPSTLPLATSLKIASRNDFNITKLAVLLRDSILNYTGNALLAEKYMLDYNRYLYRRGLKQTFSDSNGKWEATILGVLPDGTLQVQLTDGTIISYYHGQVTWEWPL